MKKILFLTVGGSCEPIITSINHHKPDKIFFFCSNDTDSVSKGSYTSVNGDSKACNDKGSIIKQLKLKENQYEIVILEKGAEDDPDISFAKIKARINQLIEEYPDSEFIADYTGGTKSMSISLFNAAISFDKIKVYLVTGTRMNLIKVKNLTQSSISLNFSGFILDRQLSYLKAVLKKYDYSSGFKIITNLLANDSHFSLTKKNELQKIKSFCQIFDNWDMFDHKTAYELLDSDRKTYLDYLLQLTKVLTIRVKLDPEFILPNGFKTDKKASFEIVHDLILNAQRRASQSRYDDAVGRIYRALELFAQIYLFNYFRIKTSNVDLKVLPDKAKLCFEKKTRETEKIKLGLMESYRLIACLENEPKVAKVFTTQEKKIMFELEKRNNSLLAHGFKPLDKIQFDVFITTISDFLDQCYEVLGIKSQNFCKQLPSDLPFNI